MTLNWRPLGNYYRIDITMPAEKTKGGIYLPDQDVWRCNEGTVTAVGAGHPDEPGRFLQQARVGERVLFQRQDLEPGPNENEAVIADEDLVGILTGNEWGVEPCGEWLLLKPDGRTDETKGGLAVPERYQNRRRSGMLLAWGPGRMRPKGPLRGTRIPCADLLDVEDLGMLQRLRLYYRSTALILFRPGAEDWWLVKAADIIAIEENDHG